MTARRKTVKTVKQKPRKSITERKTFDDIHYGPEPDVDYFVNHSMSTFLGWYNYMWDSKYAKTVLIKYAKKLGYKNASKFTKMIIPSHLSYIATGLERGLTFPAHKNTEEGETGNEYYQKYIHVELGKYNKQAQELHNLYLNDESNPETIVKKKTVQENINSKVQLLLAEVDYAIDVWDEEIFDMYKYLSENKVSATVAKKIPEEYQGLLDEVVEARDGKSDQLKEAYSYLSKNKKDQLINFIKKIQTDSERYAKNHKPIRKPRKAKQFSAKERISKLSFLDEDTDNKITSIDPSKIVGAEILYLFNSKTNQLAYYHSSDRGGLDVKGSSIKNFDTDKSEVKKLGVRTTHFLDRVLAGGKIVLNKTMNEVNSKASKVTGRVNNNMIILKVI